MLMVSCVRNAGPEDVGGPTRQEVANNIGLESRRVLAECRRERRKITDAGRFWAMVVDGDSLEKYSRNNFQRDTAIDAWNRQRAMLRKRLAGNLIHVRFTYMPFIRCQQGMWYCRTLRDAVIARMKVEDRDLHLRCWFLNKPYSSSYSLHGRPYRTRSLELKVWQHTAVRNSLFAGWYGLELFSVPLRELRCYYVQLTPS